MKELVKNINKIIATIDEILFLFGIFAKNENISSTIIQNNGEMIKYNIFEITKNI